ncbi:hypothetical protein BKA70DRAFT_1319105 [Coprinopsis sp. MPI-PUGE-AT-0042]|nr:hypothetical protein BKA70DRAFT_1319105 [Coprinopsis sp. MPI-PUGE-AT-0042]
MIPTRKLYFIGLNAVRALSVVSLILVFSATILNMVNNVKAVNAFEAAKIDANSTDIQELLDCEYIEGSTVPNQPAGVFWAIVASLLVIFQIIILFLSEVSWPMAFFDRFFPVLGTEFGLGALGIFQALISTQILSHHVDDFTLVAAFFLFALACINMLLGLIFRAGAKEKRSIRGWRAENKAVLPTSEKNIRVAFPTAGATHVSFANEKPMSYFGGAERSDSWRSTDKAGMGFGRQAERAANLRGFILTKPEESLPRYVSPPSSSRGHSRRSSSASSESSFAATNRSESGRQEQLRQAVFASRHEREPESRSQTPVFKSSQTAI